MAASSTYLSPKNHRYFSGERSTTTVTDLLFEFSEFDIYNVSSSPEFHKSIKTSRISNKSSPEMNNRRNSRTGVKTSAMSLPVDVPNWSMILKQTETETRRSNDGVDDFEFDTDLVDCDDVIPPHEYLAKERIASLSVHEGIGRTLKGRDLSRVRNAVWKKIGFED